MRLFMISLAAMAASTATVVLLFLYALIAPTRPAPSVAIVVMPDASFTGAPVEEPFVRVASQSR
jgi:hypothetical protein